MTTATLQKFLDLLAIADSVRVDGQLIDYRDSGQIADDADNEIVFFSWIDDEGLVYSVELNEGGIAKGQWMEGMFFCPDSKGTLTGITLYKHIKLVP